MNRDNDNKKIEKKLKEESDYSRVKVTSKIDFYSDENNNLLKIKMSEDSVKANMQENEAAFEGWAICIKRWLGLEKVELSWEAPKQEENKHYQRFLYRVKNFEEMYSWFTVANADYPEKLTLKYELDEEFLINSSDDERKKIEINNKDLAEGNEKDLEYYLSSNKNLLSKICNTEFKDLSFQLPVGIFKDSIAEKNKIFPGGSSAIDLFGTDDDITYIFELKVASKMVGIISQIYCYAFLICDLQNGKLKFNEEDEYLNSIKKTDELKAVMLTDDFHPLIDGKVVEEMNKAGNIDFDAYLIEFTGVNITRFDK
ncbi:hypothetical protein MWH25_02425 [Natroniella acetigena]|uniref:hypothetical protein n=1 Tax=Natroniella acetigena TaxID=52004 RepID=UPI00200A841E|nr:hypothetical protein [Natroniella acetigena]MCK8826605.1 hypothetical protein [Natroniella acetigena]